MKLFTIVTVILPLLVVARPLGVFQSTGLIRRSLTDPDLTRSLSPNPPREPGPNRMENTSHDDGDTRFKARKPDEWPDQGTVNPSDIGIRYGNLPGSDFDTDTDYGAGTRTVVPGPGSHAGHGSTTDVEPGPGSHAGHGSTTDVVPGPGSHAGHGSATDVEPGPGSYAEDVEPGPGSYAEDVEPEYYISKGRKVLPRLLGPPLKHKGKVPDEKVNALDTASSRWWAWESEVGSILSTSARFKKKLSGLRTAKSWYNQLARQSHIPEISYRPEGKRAEHRGSGPRKPTHLPEGATPSVPHDHADHDARIELDAKATNYEVWNNRYATNQSTRMINLRSMAKTRYNRAAEKYGFLLIW